MAFAAGSRARVKLTSAAFTGAFGLLQPQPPLIGVVTDVTGTTITVDMGNGTALVEDQTVLDEIGDAPVAPLNIRDLYIDKVVNGWITPPAPPVAGVPYSSSYTGRVVDVYTVNAAVYVLIQSLLNGMFYELPMANVNVLAGR